MKRLFLAPLLIASVLLIGYVDLVTPFEYSLALLYFIPIMFTAMRASMASNFAMVIFVSAVWFLADYLSANSPLKAYSTSALIWSVALKMVIMGIVSFYIVKTQRILRELRESQKRVEHLNENLEQLVELRTAKLRESVAELEAFSHSLVHDMRSPLRAMHGFAEILLTEQCNKCASAEGQAYLQRIIASSNRLDSLIIDALSYTKLAKGDMPLQPLDAGALVREILDSYPTLQIHKDEIFVKGEFPLVSANRAALTQCISNLLANAVKFVTPGKKPQVCVWSEKRDKSIRLWFEDNGIGIPRGWEEKIFQMFAQASKSYGGTGVGLALVRKAAQRMGGEVGVESTPLKGSRFWLELKAA